MVLITKSSVTAFVYRAKGSEMNVHRKISRHSKLLVLVFGVMLLSGYLLLAISSEWYTECDTVWFKLISRWGNPDQSIGSGLIRNYYYLSDQCTARVITTDKIYLTLLENGEILIDLVVPKWIAYVIVDCEILILLLMVSVFIILWKIAKQEKIIFK